MIKIFKLTNSVELMGQIDVSLLTNSEDYVIMNPMQIVNDNDINYGSLRLRDALLLSNEQEMTIPKHFCVYSYNPSEAMVEYYNVACMYYKEYTKKDVDNQIYEATMDLTRQLKVKNKKGLTIDDLKQAIVKKGRLH